MKNDSLHRAVALLHNDVLQQLAAIQWCVSELQRRGVASPDSANALKLISEAAAAAMTSTRGAIDELGPSPDLPA
jgi:signal transduction histidine kinase